MEKPKVERTIFENKNINYRILEMYGGRLLAKVILRKLMRRIWKGPSVERAIMYNGVLVFDKPELHGEGMTVGQDFIRALLELGFRRCERMFEFCAGPGYIGYSILANGFCEKLTLADINPFAVEMAKKTARFNGIEHLVNVYQSDVLDQIPEHEKWDLVVGNPPHFLPRSPHDKNIKAFDPDWRVHKKFYASVKCFMKPDGFIVMQENIRGSTVELFKPMIEGGGGEVVSWKPGIDVCGRGNSMYYLVSQW